MHLTLDDVRLAIWRWTPEEREALRRELAQEDDWAEAERECRAMLAEAERRPPVYERRAEPRLMPVAEEQTEYRADDE